MEYYQWSSSYEFLLLSAIAILPICTKQSESGENIPPCVLNHAHTNSATPFGENAEEQQEEDFRNLPGEPDRQNGEDTGCEDRSELELGNANGQVAQSFFS